MSKGRLIGGLAVLALLAVAGGALAQIGDEEVKYDKRVQESLVELGIHYEVDGDGDFNVVFELEDGCLLLVRRPYGRFEDQARQVDLEIQAGR